MEQHIDHRQKFVWLWILLGVTMPQKVKLKWDKICRNKIILDRLEKNKNLNKVELQEKTQIKLRDQEEFYYDLNVLKSILKYNDQSFELIRSKKNCFI